MTYKSYKITVKEDHLFSFFKVYDKLGKHQKKILRRLIWYYNKYPNAHPSQEKIAAGIPCSREHVNRTIALFKSYGWLWLDFRGPRKTKTIKMHDWLALIDLDKRQWFRRIEITSEITHSYLPNKRYTGGKTGGAIPPLSIPNYLQNLRISLDSKLKLSLVSQHTYQETLHACKRKSEKGFFPKNEEKYFVGFALKMAMKKGEKIDWPSYYKIVEKNAQKHT